MGKRKQRACYVLDCKNNVHASSKIGSIEEIKATFEEAQLHYAQHQHRYKVQYYIILCNQDKHIDQHVASVWGILHLSAVHRLISYKVIWGRSLGLKGVSVPGIKCAIRVINCDFNVQQKYQPRLWPGCKTFKADIISMREVLNTVLNRITVTVRQKLFDSTYQHPTTMMSPSLLLLNWGAGWTICQWLPYGFWVAWQGMAAAYDSGNNSTMSTFNKNPKLTWSLCINGYTFSLYSASCHAQYY